MLKDHWPEIGTKSIAIGSAYTLCREVLRAQGHSEEHARDMTEVIMYAQLRNPRAGQGMAKLRSPGMVANPHARDMMIDRNNATAFVSGEGNPGMIVMSQAAEIAIDMCSHDQTHPVATVYTRNDNPSIAASSTGAIGYYADKIAGEGYACIIMSKPAVPLVAPHGSIDRIFSTNPLAFGFPSTEESVVIDLTTASMSYFELTERVTTLSGSKEGYDKDGRRTRCPSQILDGGSIRVFGGHKGSAIAYAIEAFAAVLGASYGGTHNERGWFNMIIAMNHGVMPGGDASGTAVAALNEIVRDSRPEWCGWYDEGINQKWESVSGKSVRVPGDGSRATFEETQRTGTISIDTLLYDNLVSQI